MNFKIGLLILLAGIAIGVISDRAYIATHREKVPADTVHHYDIVKPIPVPPIIHKKIILQHDTTFVDSSHGSVRVLRADTLLGERHDTLHVVVFIDAIPPYLNLDYRPAPIPTHIDSVVVTHFVSVPATPNPYSFVEAVIGGGLIVGGAEEKSWITAGIGAGLIVVGVITQ